MTDTLGDISALQTPPDPGQAAQNPNVQGLVVLSSNNLARLGQLQDIITNCTCAVDSIAYAGKFNADIEFSTIFHESSNTRHRKLKHLHNILVPQHRLSLLLEQTRTDAITEAAALGVVLT